MTSDKEATLADTATIGLPGYLGVFFTALSILYLEVLATRLLVFINGPDTAYYTIAVAMLGLGAAGSIVSVVPMVSSFRTAARRVAWLCAAATATTIALFRGSSLLSEFLAARSSVAFVASGVSGLIDSVVDARIGGALVVGALLSLSYLALGGALAIALRSAPRGVLHRVYAVDLLGAFAGCLLSIWVLELGSFKVSFLVALALPLVASCAFLQVGRRRRGPIVATLLIMALLVQLPAKWIEIFEPVPDASRVARVHWDSGPSEELWHTWTSYTRVAAVRKTRAETGREVVAMVEGQGDGWAYIPTYHPQSKRELRPLTLAGLPIAACDPQRVLVLLAGAGNDMVAIDSFTDGQAHITGVELIPQMIRWPLSQEKFRLKEFFERPNIEMIEAEAREFLGRDSNSYDCLVVSWSGASLAYYTGGAASVASFIYTEEAMEQMLDHLAPGGQLTSLSGNKLRLMATAREILESRGVERPELSFVVVSNGAWQQSGAFAPWNGDPLLIKPDGFTVAEVDRLAEDLEASPSLGLVYAPYRTELPRTVYHDLATAKDPTSILVSPDGLIDLRPSFDDRPYPLRALSWRMFFRTSFWSGEVPDSIREAKLNGHWRAANDLVQTLLWFVLVSLVLIVGPVAIARRKIPISMQQGNELIFFACLGAGFMFVEIGLLQKLQLLVGHPGNTIAIVLASLILSTGIGSFASAGLFRAGILTFRRAALACILVVVASVASLEAALPFILPLSPTAKSLTVFLFNLPIGFLLGQLFPQGLGAIGERARDLVPWAIAINALAGTIAAGGAQLLGPFVGSRGLLATGCAFYLVVALLPHRQREEARSIQGS